jgi:hypothetical protein
VDVKTLKINPITARRAGSSRPPFAIVQVGDEPYAISDRNWFRSHRKWSYRLRKPFPDEPVVVGEDFMLPPDYEIWIVVRQLAPGMRVRDSVCLHPSFAKDARKHEPLIKAVHNFLVVRGEPVSGEEVIALAEKYLNTRRAD